MSGSSSRHNKIVHAPSIYRAHDLRQAITRQQRQASVAPAG